MGTSTFNRSCKSSRQHRTCRKASVTDKPILFWIGSERTREPAKCRGDQSGAGSREARPGQVCVAGHDLLEPAGARVTGGCWQNPRAEATPMGTERGPSESLGKGAKQRETQSARREASLWNLRRHSAVWPRVSDPTTLGFRWSSVELENWLGFIPHWTSVASGGA